MEHSTTKGGLGMEHRCKLGWCIHHGKTHVRKDTLYNEWDVWREDDYFDKAFPTFEDAIQYAQKEARVAERNQP